MKVSLGELYAVVDLGATNVRVACGDRKGMKRKLVEATDKDRGPDGISKQIGRMIRDLKIDKPSVIAIGSIGPLNLKMGSIVNTPNLPFKTIPLIGPLSEEFDVPVKLLNDCSAAVLGESVYGAGRGKRNLVYVTFSTGLGGGVIVDGHLLSGKDGNAHEIGHLTIDPNSDLLCGCGCRGHWEAYCSGSNIPKYAKLLLRERQMKELPWENGLNNPEKLRAEHIFESASQGDPTALWMIEKIGEVNAIGFADVVNIYDPELITVGGSVALRNPALILRPIEERIDRHLINRRPEIVITPLGDEAVIYGALALAASEELFPINM